jgi:hypothetical protein
LQLVGEDGDHRLVEQRRPLVDAAQPDEGSALADGAGCDKVGHPVASSEVGDPAGRHDHPLEVRAVQRTLHLDEVAQVALLRTLRLVVQQAAGSLEPPGTRGVVPAQQQVDRDADRRHRGVAGSGRLQERAVGALPRSDGLVHPAEPPRAVGKQRQVVR